METTTVQQRAGSDGSWGLVAEKIIDRLNELRWSGKRKDLPRLLGDINEHNARRLVDGEPYNHADAIRRTASLALGWEPDGIDRLARGDESGATVINDAGPSPTDGAAGYDARIGQLDPDDVTAIEALIETYERRRGIR